MRYHSPASTNPWTTRSNQNLRPVAIVFGNISNQCRIMSLHHKAFICTHLESWHLRMTRAQEIVPTGRVVSKNKHYLFLRNLARAFQHERKGKIEGKGHSVPFFGSKSKCTFPRNPVAAAAAPPAGTASKRKSPFVGKGGPA